MWDVWDTLGALPGYQNKKPAMRPSASPGQRLLDALALRALAGQEEGPDEIAFAAYRHA
jgi:hypothetical protein